MKLTKKEQCVVVEVTTEHDYDEKYMVVLKEGYESDGVDVEFFNTQKEVKAFLKGVKKVTKSKVSKTPGTYIKKFGVGYLLYVNGESVMFKTNEKAIREYAESIGVAL